MTGSVALLDRVRHRIAPAAKTFLLKSGGFALTRRVAPSARLAILRYHAICGDEGLAYASPGICITPAAFERHVRYLAANYEVLRLPEAVERLRTSRPLPRNAVALTFDDGYADNMAAARTLAARGLSATFYLTAGCLAGGEPFWPSEIRMLVRKIRPSPVRVSVAGRAVEIALDDETGREGAIRAFTRLCKSCTIPERERLRQQLRDAAGTGPIASPMLRWDDVAEMHRLGMTIGAHTVTHANLPSAGPEAALAEIAGSRGRLEREVGAPVTMFSYPDGGAERYYTPDLQRAVADSGFLAATTSTNGFAGPGSDLFALERIEVEERLEDLVFALEVERLAFRPGAR